MRALKWLAGRALRLIPEAVRARLLPKQFRYDPARLPYIPSAPPGGTRLLIAPLNYAGQGWEWSRAVSQHGHDVWAMNMVVQTHRDFGHRADLVVPLGVYAASTRWQRQVFNGIVAGFTHVMIEAEKQPLGALLDETTVGQARKLRESGVAVVMLCHGTDIRSPFRHRAAEAESPFHDTMADQAKRLERIARENRRILDLVQAPVLVSTPGLLADVPEAGWLPVVVDTERWASGRALWAGRRPVVVHAPSNAAGKGSQFIDPVLRRLESEGLITYHRLTDVPHDAMPDAYTRADVVVDQLRIGDYGVAACEAMAAGRVVVSHVSPEVRSYVRIHTGLELPIVEADRVQLEAVIRGVVSDRAGSAAIARRGTEFIRAVHDGRRSAEVLETALASAVSPR